MLMATCSLTIACNLTDKGININSSKIQHESQSNGTCSGPSSTKFGLKSKLSEAKRTHRPCSVKKYFKSKKISKKTQHKLYLYSFLSRSSSQISYCIHGLMGLERLNEKEGQMKKNFFISIQYEFVCTFCSTSWTGCYKKV